MSNNHSKDRFIFNSQNLSGNKRDSVMILRNLAESIILQAIEDLWNIEKNALRSSFAFFLGKGFRICSDLADISVSDRRKLLSMIEESLKNSKIPALKEE